MNHIKRGKRRHDFLNLTQNRCNLRSVVVFGQSSSSEEN
uniref:Uncharacterized protein n=1 Tax=Setaria italica TaxID=4555 RepID=K3YNM4_SETIT